MAETRQGAHTGASPLWRRRSFWLGGGALAGLAALWAAAPIVGAHGFSGRGGQGFAGHGRHGFGEQILKDPDAAKRHAGMAVEWALRGVDASDEQKQQARRITDRLVDELGPLAARHREQRATVHRALTSPEVDREALESSRREALALADQASTLVVGAVADLGELLTPQQRQELAAFAHRFHAP